MKKLLLFSVVLGGLAVMSSCKKDYTCDCTFTSVPELSIELNKYKKGDAEDACTSAETTYKIADSGASCTLK
ncbi:MAG: hypothetical protein GQ574_16825 [Crocinitomix sp.]|nr:hypothetical protein [Crocinitomix sp.]